jgi:hypothetical protein
MNKSVSDSKRLAELADELEEAAMDRRGAKISPPAIIVPSLRSLR